MTRRPLISGNWKMNLNHYEAIQIVQKLHYLVPKDVYEDVDVSIHPPFTDLRSVQTVIQADDLALDMFIAPNGAITVLDEDEFAALPLDDS